MNANIWRYMLALILLVAMPVMAADSGTLTRAEPLLEKPFADAHVLTRMSSGARVDILTRSGGWYQVKSGTRTGWVRMLSVRRSTTTGSSITGLANVASGRAGTGTVTTTTGVRGLDAEDLAAAKFDAAQISRAETYRVSRKDAGAFAVQAKLAPRDVQPLPAPTAKQK